MKAKYFALFGLLVVMILSSCGNRKQASPQTGNDESLWIQTCRDHYSSLADSIENAMARGDHSADLPGIYHGSMDAMKMLDAQGASATPQWCTAEKIRNIDHLETKLAVESLARLGS